jgi:spore maturation protein CgeB
VDPVLYYPENRPHRWDLGYVGTYSEDRHAGLERLLLEPARRSPMAKFVVAGPLYPEGIDWPGNVHRIEHLPPSEHRWFYNSQRFTLNLTRSDMVRAGYSPSVRLFEAAACGTPIVSDCWPGLEEILEPGREIILAHSSEDALRLVREVPDKERKRIGERARKRVLAEHTAVHRAGQLERYAREVLGSQGASLEEAAPRRLRPARARL